MKKIIISLLMAASLVGCVSTPLTEYEKVLLQETAVRYAVSKVSVEDKSNVALKLIEIKGVVEATSYSKDELTTLVINKINDMRASEEDKVALRVIAVLAISRTEVPEIPYKEQVLKNLNTAITYLGS